MLRYDRRTIFLHWLTAGLIVVLWGSAQVIDFFPSGAPRVSVRSTHIALGVVLGLVLVARIVWRSGGGAKLPPADNGWMGLLATGVHYLLYALVALMILCGLVNAWVRGDSVYGLFKLVSFAPGDRATRQFVGGLHELGANLILAAAGLHAAAALLHHFVLRDGVLRRMLPRA